MTKLEYSNITKVDLISVPKSKRRTSVANPSTKKKIYHYFQNSKRKVYERTLCSEFQNGKIASTIEHDKYYVHYSHKTFDT